MISIKQLNEFAESRGYRDWIEFKAYEEPETVREARKMIERGLLMDNEDENGGHGYMEFGSIGSAVVQVFRADDNEGCENDDR